MNTLSRSFYSRDSEEVARDLLGKKLVKGNMEGVIAETEAYYGEDDPASHAHRGKTERNLIMFREAGRVYVYLCYGIHYLLNITTRRKGEPGAVLIRALKPSKGLDEMKSRRGIYKESELTNGPGKLTQAMGVDLSYNGLDVTEERSELEVVAGKRDGLEVERSGRIGINRGGGKELRFFVKDSKYVSRRQ